MVISQAYFSRNKRNQDKDKDYQVQLSKLCLLQADGATKRSILTRSNGTKTDFNPQMKQFLETARMLSRK
jgi:hypothetical protein